LGQGTNSAEAAMGLKALRAPGLARRQLAPALLNIGFPAGAAAGQIGEKLEARPGIEPG
jgi:hypothetical protein